MLTPTIISNTNPSAACDGNRTAPLLCATLNTRVLCLYRVSSDKQLYYDDEKNVDIPMQRIRCREYAAAQGWSIVCELQEEGVSGYKVRAADRDKIQLIKEYALNKQFDILLVFMFDRIGRIADETPFVVEWLVNNGVRVVSVCEGEQKFESHTDRLLNYIRFWQADGESQKTSIRTANSLHILTEQGHFTGGACPYGYSFVKKGRVNKRKHEVYDLAICENEALIVTLMFTLAANEGYGAQRIANHLYKVGIKNRSGNNWHPATIRAILKNILYTGVLRSGDSRSEVIPELQIIDIPTFDKVQALHLARSKIHAQTRAVPRANKSPALLIGFIFCGDCGARLHATTCGNGRRRADGTEILRTRYACQTKTRSHGECAGQSVYVLDKIDSAVEEQVFSIFAKLKRLSRQDAVNTCLTSRIREKESVAQCARHACGGQTGYTMHILDKLVTDVLHEVFSRMRSMDGDELVSRTTRNAMVGLKERIASVKAECAQTTKEYESLKLEIVKAVQGQSALPMEVLSELVNNARTKMLDADNRLTELTAELDENNQRLNAIKADYNRIMGWSEIFDSSDMEVKKMIAGYIIKRVDVYSDYRLHITFNINFAQFELGLELPEDVIAEQPT